MLAPYILTALIETPKRLVYLSSGMHHAVRPRMDDLLWTKRAWGGSTAYEELLAECGRISGTAFTDQPAR